MSEMIYKIVRRFEWDEAEKAGVFTGSADDRRDGFIHFSTAAQVNTTFDKYFSQEQHLLVVSVDARLLGSALKWEVSRRGENFPHLYAPLQLTLVHSAREIRREADGRPIFGPEFTR